MRTEHLDDLIRLHKPRVITEIGVARCVTALHMIDRAFKEHDNITYHGFDLFEDLDDARIKSEFQGKKPITFDQACKIFTDAASRYADHGKTLHWNLQRGATTKTLLHCQKEALNADLVYLDGGHSVETIKHDLQAVSGSRVILLDGFYHDRDPNFMQRWGCNMVVQELFPGDFAFMPIIDRVPGADGQPIDIGQVTVPRSAWPLARLMVPLTVVRQIKPKMVFVYADPVSSRYLGREIAAHGGTVTEIFDRADIDVAYVDCVCGDQYMDRDEALDAWEKIKHVPVKVFGGLVLDKSILDGAGHILHADTAIDQMTISGLDRFGEREVGCFISPKSAWQQKARIHVATRNCVDNEVIIANIQANAPRIRRWIEMCRPHDGKILFVSAGPSLKELLPEINERAEKAKVVCVKHAHDKLIEAGIVPWGCILLDPRDHVQQFVQNPHPKTIYFTASMVSATTLDILLAKRAHVVGYHALVGAGEDKILPKGTMFMVGGTSAAVRGLPLLLTLGFRDFTLYAYDSCFDERPGNLGEKTKLGYDRYVKVEIGGKKFWTELELVAQAQDFKEFLTILNQTEMTSAIKLDVRGRGICKHLHDLMRPIRPAFEDLARIF